MLYRPICRRIPVYLYTSRYFIAANNVTPTTETYKTNFIRDVQVLYLRVSSRELRYYFNVFRFFLCDELKHHKSLSKTSVYYILWLFRIYIYLLVYMIYLYCTHNTQYTYYTVQREWRPRLFAYSRRVQLERRVTYRARF